MSHASGYSGGYGGSVASDGSDASGDDQVRTLAGGYASAPSSPRELLSRRRRRRRRGAPPAADGSLSDGSGSVGAGAGVGGAFAAHSSAPYTSLAGAGAAGRLGGGDGTRRQGRRKLLLPVGAGSAKFSTDTIAAVLFCSGTWLAHSSVPGELAIEFDYGAKQLVLQRVDGGLVFRMMIRFVAMSGIGANPAPREGLVCLSLRLSEPPHFLVEVDPQPMLESVWQSCPDFTGGQVSGVRQVDVLCAGDELQRCMGKLRRSGPLIRELVAVGLPPSPVVTKILEMLAERSGGGGSPASATNSDEVPRLSGGMMTVEDQMRQAQMFTGSGGVDGPGM